MEVHNIAKTSSLRRSGRRGRLFSLEHASRSLPLVRRIVVDIVRQHKRVSALEERCLVPNPDDVNDEALDAVRRQYDAALDKLHEFCEEIAAIGCELKDVRRGIVDFRILYRGREVELCWRLGQEKIEYWHDLDDGFHDRRMIDADFTAEVSRAGIPD